MTHDRLSSLLVVALFAMASAGCGDDKGTEKKPSAGTTPPAAAKITTVEAATKALKGKWQLNDAATKQHIDNPPEGMLPVPHATFTEAGGLEWPGAFGDGGL